MKIKTMIFSAFAMVSSLAFGEGRVIAVNGYAAAVNDRVITDGEIQEAAEPQIRRLETQFNAQVIEQQTPMIFKMTLAGLIERALILEEFESLGYAVPEKAVLQREVDYIEKNFDGSRVKFQEFLRDEEKTLEEWRKATSDDVEIEMLRYREIFARIDISPLEVRRAYESAKREFVDGEKVKTRVIEIAFGGNADDARKKAEAILVRAKSSEDFAKLATEVSEGVRASRGGEMPEMDPNDLRVELKEAIYKLQPGEVSEVIEFENGFYIVKLETRTEGRQMSFSEVRDEIEANLKNKEVARLSKRWIERLRRKHIVQYF